MQWFEPLELSLRHLVTVSKFALETLSVLCVIVGTVKTLQVGWRSLGFNSPHTSTFNKMRFLFGRWLALALEFQLGADIIGTTVAPTWQDLTQLALIALIRTFLNYFLGKELESEQKLQREMQEERNS
ncbi:MAG: hypothetical protein N5P05_001214 [Chroococcopsis gigantea SAG 12.99]|jgi:uncharacterized membrane protein|nr:DUF1622 domain-containing protein [Chlorogloea purpurea SAG 13.99]MDV2999608.1 hypothetical protein [Chroococcopsis gigantea SAG 12.99]